jgi:hypothetical protein
VETPQRIVRYGVVAVNDSVLPAEKKRVLDDHLAREEFAEKVRMMNRNHVDKFEKLQIWIAEKVAYLNIKENINNVAEARTALRWCILMYVCIDFPSANWKLMKEKKVY